MLTITTRAEARASLIKRYFTGAPCKLGHLAERLVSNGSCLACVNLKQKAAYHADIEGNRQKQKIRRDSDPNRILKKRARRVAKEPDYALRSDAWRLANQARRLAREQGVSQYLASRPCHRGHLGSRFTTTGKCVECNRLKCQARYEARVAKDPAILAFRDAHAYRAAKREAGLARSTRYQEIRVARQTAISAGQRTYVGRPCPRGHSGERYTAHGSCVHCLATYSASEEKKRYDLTYFARNRESILRRSRAYAKSNAAKVTENTRRWVAANPAKRRSISKSYKARRRAKERTGDSTAAVHAWEMAAMKQCYWCGVPCADSYHVDHYEPLARGGLHVVTNLVIACPRCNLTKSARDPYEFAASIGRLF